MKQLKSLGAYIVVLGIIFIAMIILFLKIRKETAIRTEVISPPQLTPQPQGEVISVEPTLAPAGVEEIPPTAPQLTQPQIGASSATQSAPFPSQPVSGPRPSGAGAPPPPIPPEFGAPSSGPQMQGPTLPPEKLPVPILPESRERK